MLVALPAAIAFGVLVFTAIGPEHAGRGAMFGALGAAAIGLVAPLVSGNGGFITAPCAPAAAVLSGFAAHLASGGAMPLERILALMVLAALLSALMQIAYGLLRFGRFIKYIPYQVVTGYLSGVALVIAVGQLPKLLGLPGDVGLLEGLIRPDLWQTTAIAVGAMTIAVMAVAPRLTQRVPPAILGLAAGVATYFALAAFRPELLTTAANPLVIGPLDASARLGDVVTQGASSILSMRFGDLSIAFATAATLSALLSIDTLKTGVVLDALTRRRHDSNRELLAQGAANAVAAMTGGMAGAGTMGPTLVNVTSGGRSRWSGVAEGAFVVVAFLLLRELIAWVPIGALAGILLVVAWKMFDWKVFGLALRRSTRLDFAVIATVVVVAKTVGLIEASLSGIALAILLFIRDQVRGSVLIRKRDLSAVSSKSARTTEERELLDRFADQGLLVELRDNLFFGTTDQVFSDLMEDLSRRRFVLLDLRRVQSVDYTAVHLLHQMHERLAERGGRLLLSGMPSASQTGIDIEHYLTEAGLLGDDGAVPVFETRNEALAWMEEQLLAAAGWVDPAEKPPLELAELDLFREFDEQMLAALAAIVEAVHIEAGGRVFALGDESDAMFLVRRGVVEISLPLGGGKRHHVATISRGGYFGEMAFLDKLNRSADAVAKTGVDLYVLSRQRFNELARGDAVVGVKVFARLALLVSRRLRAADAELRALEQR